MGNRYGFARMLSSKAGLATRTGVADPSAVTDTLLALSVMGGEVAAVVNLLVGVATKASTGPPVGTFGGTKDLPANG